MTDRTRSPFELDLGRLVDFSKPNFTGRRALWDEQQRGSRFRLVRLDVEGNKPAKDAYIYDPQRSNIGVVTSSMWSPAAKASIALASVRMPWGKSGEELLAEIYLPEGTEVESVHGALPCRRWRVLRSGAPTPDSGRPIYRRIARHARSGIQRFWTGATGQRSAGH